MLDVDHCCRQTMIYCGSQLYSNTQNTIKKFGTPLCVSPIKLNTNPKSTQPKCKLYLMLNSVWTVASCGDNPPKLKHNFPKVGIARSKLWRWTFSYIQIKLKATLMSSLQTLDQESEFIWSSSAVLKLGNIMTLNRFTSKKNFFRMGFNRVLGSLYRKFVSNSIYFSRSSARVKSRSLYFRGIF